MFMDLNSAAQGAKQCSLIIDLTIHFCSTKLFFPQDYFPRINHHTLKHSGNTQNQLSAKRISKLFIGVSSLSSILLSLLLMFTLVILLLRDNEEECIYNRRSYYKNYFTIIQNCLTISHAVFCKIITQ